MKLMFNNCYKLKEIKGINKFNTSKVKNCKVVNSDQFIFDLYLNRNKKIYYFLYISNNK